MTKKGRYFVSLKGAHTKHPPCYHVSSTLSALTGIRLFTEFRTWGSARLGFISENFDSVRILTQ